MEVLVIVVALVALDVLAFRFGVDSRDGFRARDASRTQGRVRVWWAEPERDLHRRRPAEAPATW